LKSLAPILLFIAAQAGAANLADARYVQYQRISDLAARRLFRTPGRAAP
jgi:hypothetical protein